MMTYQWEPWGSLIQEAMPMLVHYWKTEGILFGDELPLDVDFKALADLEFIGRLQVYTVRENGRLVGMNSFNVGGTLFRRSTVSAAGLVLYTLPSVRNYKVGRALIVGAEPGLKALGTQLIVYTPSSRVEIGPLLEHFGYERIGGSFEKML